MVTNSTNVQLRKLISDLRSKKEDLWKRIASELEKPRRNRRTVNLSRVNRYSMDGETVVVPGKLLADGDITVKVSVAALNASEAAKKKVTHNGGKFYSIEELLKTNPSAKGVRIVG